MKTLMIAAAAAALASPAAAGRPTPDDLTVTVAYSDLVLSEPADARRMLRRIEDGAKLACEKKRAAYRAGVHVGPVETVARCRSDAARDAVRRLKSPVVRQAYATRPGPTRLLADAR